MATNGEEPKLIVLGELTEADGTIEGLFRANDLTVEEDGERIDEGLVEAGIVEVEELLELSLEGIGVGDFLIGMV